MYQLPLPLKHRFPMEKYDLLPRQLIHEGSCTSEDFFTPTALDRAIIERIHHPEYVKKLLALDLNKKEARKIGFPLSKELIEREILIAVIFVFSRSTSCLYLALSFEASKSKKRAN